VEEFRRTLFALCPPAEPLDRAADELADFLVYRPQPEQRRFRILRTDRGYRVHGSASDEEVEEALRAAGIRTGQVVEIGDEELEWE
jgi:hypothetical protein